MSTNSISITGIVTHTPVGPRILDWATESHPIFSKPEERSQEFIDFVKLCLDKNPSQRATATELLQHNFITQNNTARGREILLEVIHQAQEIKKRKKAKNQQTNRKNSDSRHENGPYFSKKSSDSDSGKWPRYLWFLQLGRCPKIPYWVGK